MRAAVAGDRDIAARVALFRETRRVAQDAFSGMLREPMPEHLIRAVVPLARPARTGRWRPAAMAAAFVLAVGTAGWLGYGAGGSGWDGVASLRRARRERVCVGVRPEPDPGRRRAFLDQRSRPLGEDCRRRHLPVGRWPQLAAASRRAWATTAASTVCPAGRSSWAVAFAARGALPPRAGDGAYRPAGAAAGDLAAVLDARHAQGPLSAEDVRRLIERGWTE